MSIGKELGVIESFDPRMEVQQRTFFLAKYFMKSGAKSLVLGISGGIDSTVAGILCQRAVALVRHITEKDDYKFIAVRLPYGVQLDEEDAVQALISIGPDKIKTVDIKPSVDAIVNELEEGQVFFDPNRRHFDIGNIKARQRMVVQYAVAAAFEGLVVGTDHAAEALMGFFTKFGDGAADLVPLQGLNKRRIRQMADVLGVPHELIWKTPTADLESDKPLKPDEEAFGVTYDTIDDFLEGKPVGREAAGIITEAFNKTKHKRILPIGPCDE